MTSRTIGLIGVGLVGTALAERLLKNGWKVIGFDLDASRLEHLQKLNGEAASSPSDVLNRATTIVLSLPTSAIATSVITGLPGSLSGRLIIDTTTGEPSEMVALGEHLAAHGASYLDATIAGSSVQVRTGDVIVMVGGEASALAAGDDFFRSFARHTFHVGPWGAGAKMKLVVNLVLGLHRAVLAEGLAFAERTGIDPHQALKVLKAGPTYSQVMDTKADKMLAADFTPQARLSQHLKDVRLILSAGADAGAYLPLSKLHVELLERLEQDGFGALDNSAIFKAFSAP